MKCPRCQAQLLDRYVLPKLGHYRLRDLRKRYIRALLSEKRGQGYAQNTVRLIKAALSSVLTDASEDEIIDVNPALHLSRKKSKRAGGALFDVMALTGLRPSDALALQPGDLDLKNELIRVERALSGRRAKATKTEETRKVHMNPDLRFTLERHLLWLKEQTLRHGFGLCERRQDLSPDLERGPTPSFWGV